MFNDAGWQIAGIIGGLYMALLSWIGVAQVKRINALERGKANKESTDARFADMLKRLDDHMAEDRRMHDSLGEKLDTTNRHLSDTNVALAKIIGRSEGRAERG